MSGAASSGLVASCTSRPSRGAPASDERSRALGERVGVAARADQRRQQAVLIAAGVAEAVPEEVDGAALPGAAEDLRDRRLQPGVRVGDGQLDADQSAGDQAPEELGPERLRLGLADVDAQN